MIDKDILKFVYIHHTHTLTLGFAEYSLVRRLGMKDKTQFYIRMRIRHVEVKKYNFDVVCKLKLIGT